MQALSEPANVSEKPITGNQDSDERKQSRVKPTASKKKLIRKKNKTKVKQAQVLEPTQVPEVKPPNPFDYGVILESQTQKCQRLEQYLRKDIEEFYKKEIQPYEYQVLDNLLNCNLIQLSDVHHKNLGQVWREKVCSLAEIRSYLELIFNIKQNQDNFTILADEHQLKYYIYFPQSQALHEISQFEFILLSKRSQFLSVMKNFETVLEKRSENMVQASQPQKMSELSTEITFLFKSLYDSTKILKQYIINLKHNIQSIIKSEPVIESHEIAENRYVTYLVKKLLVNCLKDREIDYLNFFKNNELAEHNFGPSQSSFTDQKQFEEFMRKKKNKKGKKGKYVLHTACLGCCSSYYEQYNPFSYCQQCYVRFHRSCYAGYPVREEIMYITSRQEKDVLCEPCYNKKNAPNYKSRGNECDLCGMKGLLSIPTGQSKRIHIFCMLLNGLWKVNNGRVEYQPKTDKIPSSDSLKCIFCNSGTGYLHFCCNCERYVHVSCAYFNGWKIDADFDQFSQNVELKLACCKDVPVAENQKRRKFVTNYKKQAYSF